MRLLPNIVNSEYSKYIQIYEEIKDVIINNKIKEGELLPYEKELQENIVSRGTVRQALIYWNQMAFKK